MMNLSSSLLAFIVMLLLSSEKISGRKDVGEYWKTSMKDQRIPERNLEKQNNWRDKKFFMDFKEVPNIWNHDNGVKSANIYTKIFDLSPYASIYDNGIKPTDHENICTKNFNMNSGCRVYDNQIKPADHEKKFYKDFEETPSTWIYNSGIKSDQEKKVRVNDLKTGI